MIDKKYLGRLTDNIISAGIAISGIDSNGNVTPANLQSQAQSIIDNFIQTDAAQKTWLDSKAQSTAAADTDYSALINAAQNAITNNTTYSAIASPTQAQAVAQVGKLTIQNTQIINVLLKVLKQINQ